MNINEYHMHAESQSYSYILSLEEAKQEQVQYVLTGPLTPLFSFHPHFLGLNMSS